MVVDTGTPCPVPLARQWIATNGRDRLSFKQLDNESAGGTLYSHIWTRRMGLSAAASTRQTKEEVDKWTDTMKRIRQVRAATYCMVSVC